MLPEPEEIEDSNISIASCADDRVKRPAKLVNAAERIDISFVLRPCAQRRGTEEKPTIFSLLMDEGEMNPAEHGEHNTANETSCRIVPAALALCRGSKRLL